MQTYEKHKVVEQDDLDELHHVNNVNYVQWVQDIAEEHWESKATNSIKSNYYWVLVEHNIKYVAPAILGDVLKLRTFVIASKGVKSIRKVEIYNQNSDQLLVESTTTWAFISRETKKPARITNQVVDMFC